MTSLCRQDPPLADTKAQPVLFSTRLLGKFHFLGVCSFNAVAVRGGATSISFKRLLFCLDNPTEGSMLIYTESRDPVGLSSCVYEGAKLEKQIKP